MEEEHSANTRRIGALLSLKSSTITHIHLSGLPSSDRNIVLNEVIEELEKREEAAFVRVNCVVVEGSSRRLCREIISCLPDSSAASGVSSLEQLFDHIESLIELHAAKKTLAIVFFHAEKLLRFPSTYLKALFSSPKKYGGRVKLVTVSELRWANFESVERLSSPIQFTFRTLSKDELLNIMCKRVPYGEKFVHLVLDTVYQVCKDPIQLQYLMESFWSQNEQLCSLVCGLSYETTSNDYRALQPKLRHCCNDLFYRFDANLTHQGGDEVVNLPSRSKFVLIAAYCASYNPISSDRRFFTKNHGVQRRRPTNVSAARSDPAHECGPKSFDLQRLLFIYLSILEMYDERKEGCSDISTQIWELCRMGYLIRISADGNLDLPKFKCLTSLETVSRLAESFGMKLADYLFDFTI
uniref:Origin recognition complex subunit 5 C-terminal domain-containing protein n=1 Tax=Parascaris univalens TaxID=6257 RepID=A0A914ZGI5_PARUN